MVASLGQCLVEASRKSLTEFSIHRVAESYVFTDKKENEIFLIYGGKFAHFLIY